MRAFVVWAVMAFVSVGMGLTLYSTSLAGSTSHYQEAPVTPVPTSTVVKTRTRVVRKPGKTKVVYVTQTPAPVSVPVQPAPVPQANDARRSEED